MNDMVAIKSSKLPAHLAGKVKGGNVFAAAVSAGGFPVVSIKGKVFHLIRGDERTLVTKGEDGEPAASLEAVILSVNPNKSKVFYDSGYEEGSVAKPTCYSNDGLAPASDSESPQATKCAVCPHNQWGSRITDNGGKGKACSDSMRLAVAAPDQLNDPMLLRVPAASLKTLGLYGAQLAKRGVEPLHVVTKIGFDYNVAHPALTFKATRFVEAEEFGEVEAVLLNEAETIGQITGISGGVVSVSEQQAEAPAPKPAPAPKAPAPVAAVEEVVAAPVAAEPSTTKNVDDFDNIGDALDNLDFDD
tara:strand:- start:9686 stop:10594 length:909 start_codon:yes stop_codon:yes gene_type:complete